MRHEQREQHRDEQDVAEQRERPGQVVADDVALAAHLGGGRDADAGGLRRDGLAEGRADTVERGEQHVGHAEQPAHRQLERAEQRVRRRGAAGQRDGDPSEDRGEEDERGPESGEGGGQGVPHARVVEHRGEPEDQRSDQQGSPHLRQRRPEGPLELPP